MKSVRVPMNPMEESFLPPEKKRAERPHMERPHMERPHVSNAGHVLLIKSLAEFIGTSTLVLFGCGSVVLPPSGTSNLQFALAFGFTLLFLVYSIGPISGCHINPAVSLGVYITNRGNMKFSIMDLIAYWIAQFLGGITGAAVLYGIVNGRPDYDIDINGLGANGWGPGYADHYSMGSAFLAEFVFTFIFLVNILAVTSEGNDPTTAGISIGITLSAIHLANLPITGVSVNPARSFAVAVFVGGARMEQVWLFFLAPCFGAIFAALLFRNKATLEHHKVHKFIFELIGTFTLVLIGVGSVVLPLKPDRIATSFAFGFALVSIAYAIGPITGAHVNPAVTLGVYLSNRNSISKKDVPIYWLGQFLGGILGAVTLYLLAIGREGYSLPVNGLGVNGWGPGYAECFTTPSAFFAEVIFTFLFLVNILGSTGRCGTSLAGLSIGLTLTAIHIISLPITGTSVNPARSLGPALIVGGKSFEQFFLFLFAPTIGAALAGLFFRWKIFDLPHPGIK